MEYDRLLLATSYKTTPKSYDESLNTNEIIFQKSYTYIFNLIA